MSRTYTKEELAEVLRKHIAWRLGEKGGERADLSGANLSRADLSGADLSGADLSGANLSGANLSGANLSGAYLSRADLPRADLSRADLSGADLSGANLSGANLSRADLSGADLSGANLSRADLSGADLSGANLSRADLSGADLSGANLSGANLSGAYLSGANLKYWIVPEEGEFIAWKAVRDIKTSDPVVLKLRIPTEAKRSCAYSSRKCRVDRAVAIAAFNKDGTPHEALSFCSDHESSFIWTLNEITTCAEFCDDPAKECAPGLHIWITRKEAEQWL